MIGCPAALRRFEKLPCRSSAVTSRSEPPPRSDRFPPTSISPVTTPPRAKTGQQTKDLLLQEARILGFVFEDVGEAVTQALEEFFVGPRKTALASGELLLEILPLVDAIETFNARCMQARFNRQAGDFARQHGVPGTAGSDAHAAFELGRATMLLPDFHDAVSFRQALLQGPDVVDDRPELVGLEAHRDRARGEEPQVRLGLLDREREPARPRTGLHNRGTSGPARRREHGPLLRQSRRAGRADHAHTDFMGR